MESSAQPEKSAIQGSARIFFGALGSAAILLSGCAARKTPAIPWTTAVLVRPVPPEHPPLAVNPTDPVPDLRLEIPPPPAPLAPRTFPARPRSPAPAQSENARPEKLEAPQIVPDLTSQESASLQRQTDESLNVAERNLALISGKSLNPAQSDLASKVRGFISDAREAGRAGDWVGASDLAQKARVLSEQLARSL
ncbi:MAG: hypothetical protein WA817_11970 [Candidatus Acidiferrum sp.]